MIEKLDECQALTEALLAHHSFRLEGPEPDLAQAVGSRMQLEATRWVSPVAEARLVRIRGNSVSIFNCLIFPFCPDRSPVFVAELLVTGGQLRLAFLDVQTPGLRDPSIACSRTAELAKRYGGLNHREPAPRWALEFSSGYPAYLRPTGQVEIPMTELYSDYLRVWADLTQAAPPQPSSELDSFKRLHRDESPVADYLTRVFGEAWASRFMNGFLYR